MFSSGIRQKQGIQIPFALILTAVFVGSFVLISPSDGFSVSALRSRVYGFRNTDNKQAVQLAGQLGIKVTIDTHSSSVVVLTGDDPLELTRAYSLMEITDRKEPVSMKVFGSVPDSKAEETVKQLHDQLKNLNLGTLLDPPAKVVANPSIVDIYQGELIAIASAAEMEKIEKAYKAWQDKQKSQRPKTSEPNTANPIQLSSSKSVEPNAPASQSPAAEPNTPQPAPTPAPQPIKQTSTEPNKPARQEQPAPQPAAAPTQQKAIEPNQAKPEEPQTQEDFMSNELLKTLASEEIKTQRDKTTPSMDKPALPGTAKTGMAEAPVRMPKTKIADTTDTNTIQPPTQEITDAEFKKIVGQLMKQSQEEEKKAQGEQTTAREQKALQEQAGEAKEKKAEQTPASSGQAAAAAPPPVQKSQQLETKAEKPVEPQIESKPEKTAKTETAPKTKTESEPSAAEQKVKTTGAEPAIPKGEEELELTITLPEKVEIKQLIELVGKQLGLNYMYDETKVRGEVMLKIHDGKIKVKDCYALLESVLRYKGFVMTRRGSLVTIVPSTEVNASDPKIHIGGQQIEAGDVIVNGVFTLKYVNYNNAQGILRSLALGTNIIPIVETNTLIVTDYSYRMSKIEEVLRIIDVPGAAKIFTHRPLQYMQASVLIPRLQTLAAQLGNLSITVGTSASSAAVPSAPVRIDPRTGQPAPGGPAQMQPPSSAAGAQQAVYLDADERTNRVLIIGTEEQLKTVNSLIDSLDVRQYNLRYVKEYEIKYVDASEVIDVLNGLGLAKVTAAKSTDSSTRAATPQVPGGAARPGMPQPAVSRQAAGTTEGADQPFISIRPNTNSLLVNATGEQHEDIELVIKHIDVEQKDQRTIEEYEIQNVDAREIVQTLGDLAIISKQSVSNITSSKGSMYGSSSGSGFGTTRTSGMMNRATGMPMDQSMGMPEQSAIMSLPTAEGGTVRELITTEPQISILESTNSLLIYATPRQHASVALVIAHVDREVDRATAPYVVYPLENQDPEELAQTLMDLVEGTMKKAAAGMPSSPGAKIQTETAQTANLPKKEEEIIRIIPDKKSYSLIVYANKKNQQWVATLIKQLDQYRPQVLLGCTLVEITKDDQFTFDLDLISRKGGFPPGGTMTNTNITAIQSPFPANISLEGSVNKGTGVAFYADDHIQALLNLMDKNNYGRVLARPSLLVKDNEQGVIKAEKTIYVAEEKTVYQTPDQGQAIQTTDVQFKNYNSDITLTITPHITSEKILQLEIVLNRTDFDLSSGKTVTVGTKTIPKPYDQITSNVDTWSIIPDGATIILGGIETINQGKTNTKVPILGDLPLIGLLFRGIDQTDKQSKLYVFVKANIIKPADVLTGQSDIERISRKKRQTFEREEAKFQRLQSLPGVKPNPMDPEKILEEDEYIEELKKRQAESNVVTVPIN